MDLTVNAVTHCL